jgi:hypothetical protein
MKTFGVFTPSVASKTRTYCDAPNKWNRPHRSRFTHAAPPAPLPSSPPVPPPVGPPPPAPADALFDQFLNPPVEFRPWLRWDLNERLNPRKLGRQARDMHRLGFGGALCHEALGLAADPGGPPWREALDATREAVRDINFTLVVGERVSGRRPPVFMAGRPGASLAELRAGMDRLLARGETFIVPAAAAIPGAAIASVSPA